MSSAGRPRVLDDFKRGQICALVGSGCGIDAAARYVSCSASTIRREAIRNEEFRNNLRAAEVKAQLDPLKAMRAAASTHWRAAAWLLERINPRRFARQQSAKCNPMELHEVVDALVDKAVEEIPDPQLRDRVCRQLLATAYRASRALAAAEHKRLDPKEGTFEMPLSRDEQQMKNLLDEIQRSAVETASQLRNSQNARKSA